MQKSQFVNLFHFYAALHRDEYLNARDSAFKVLPVFVTEFGTQTYVISINTPDKSGKYSRQT